MGIKKCEVCDRTSENFKYIYNLVVDGEKHTYCSKHYQLVKLKGRTESVADMKKKRKCSVCGASNKDIEINTTSKFGSKVDLCRIHYGQLIDSGKISTKKSHNTIKIKGEYAEIELYDIEGNTIDKALVSSHRVDMVKDIKWYRVKGDKTFYVCGNKDGERLTLHQLLAEHLYGECPDGMSVDHRNQNGLDNQDGNLRYATYSEQVVNRGLLKNNSSGYTGVGFEKTTQRWRARLMFKGVGLEKRYPTFEEAVDQRKKWEKIRDSGEWVAYARKFNKLH